MITINDKVVTGMAVAFDGCHKIYVCKTRGEVLDARELGYSIYPMNKLEDIWYRTCALRFIYTWDLTEHYVRQGEEAKFGWLPTCGSAELEEAYEGIMNLSIRKEAAK